MHYLKKEPLMLKHNSSFTEKDKMLHNTTCKMAEPCHRTPPSLLYFSKIQGKQLVPKKSFKPSKKRWTHETTSNYIDKAVKGGHSKKPLHKGPETKNIPFDPFKNHFIVKFGIVRNVNWRQNLFWLKFINNFIMLLPFLSSTSKWVWRS